MSAEQNSKPLAERVEKPAGLSKENATKMARLEEEFTRTEVEACM